MSHKAFVLGAIVLVVGLLGITHNALNTNYDYSGKVIDKELVTEGFRMSCKTKLDTGLEINFIGHNCIGIPTGSEIYYKNSPFLSGYMVGVK